MMLIALDGPAASGKGTIAKRLGEYYKLPVLYTGNIYRAIAAIAIKNQIDILDINQIILIAQKLEIADLEQDNLSDELVGNNASKIAINSELRKATYVFQRDFIDNAVQRNNGAIIEGRDIGTVICPEADYKFFLTAAVEIRAKRRADQNSNKNYENILADLKSRDFRDETREIAPLKLAQDSIIIDTSNFSADEAFNKIINLIKGQ